MDVTAKTHGFSLIQLITTLAFLSISLSIAVPPWLNFTQQNALSSARNQIASVLHLARNTAINQRQYITLCPSSDANHCSGDHTGWQQGYILFTDSNRNKKRDNNETLLRVGSSLQNGLTIQTSRGRKAIRYAMDGSAWGSNVTIRFCNPKNNTHNLAIILYGTGRLRLSKTLSNGKQITC
jgi:type IV fimbrial biogenesis protein FimT